MASTRTNLSVNSVKNEINYKRDMSMVLLVILLVLLSIQLRQQPNLTTIQHNLKTDTPKEVEINKKILLYL
jgi:hypothetical protein